MRSRWGAQITLLLLGVIVPAAGTQNLPPTGNSPITLDDAIRLAQANEPTFAAAHAESRAVALERRDAKAALLPSVDFHNQYLFTQSNRTKTATKQGDASQSLPVFIANNSVHEYISQGTVNETVGLAGIASVKLADANAARAEAELEVARRGLVSTVVELYYSVRSGAEKLNISVRALDEANHFLDITEKRESAGEAAHADVLKARLGQQLRQRELAEARLANERANLELGVLLFPDPGTKFSVTEETAPPPLPELSDVETAARTNNPEIRSALASVQAGQAETLKAWAGLTPDLALNYAYGIDAPQFASHGPDGVLNRGFSASATVDIPIWDWLTSERKVKEARIRSEATRVALTAAQRRLLADLTEFYNEAEVARNTLTSLDASVIDARESLRLTNLRYTNGEGTVLEVVDAQDTLVTTENAQAEAMVQYHVALAQLGTLTGRL
jgi:outer membrane protein TolC